MRTTLSGCMPSIVNIRVFNFLHIPSYFKVPSTHHSGKYFSLIFPLITRLCPPAPLNIENLIKMKNCTLISSPTPFSFPVNPSYVYDTAHGHIRSLFTWLTTHSLPSPRIRRDKSHFKRKCP